MHKDNFSIQAIDYAKYRPVYPNALVEKIVSLTQNRQLAWDCACGNGQMANLLAPYFNEVFASDISQKQLDQAIPNSKIYYAHEPCDACSLPDKSVDLITVAQALHWFHFEHFFEEAKRVLKPGGIIATFGYGFLKTDEGVEQIIEHFYKHVVGSYWDAERRYVENEYKEIPFPFDEIVIGTFEVYYEWSAADLLGYLSTWSAVQHYRKATGLNPITLIVDAVTKAYGHNKTLPLSFPIFTTVGRH